MDHFGFASECASHNAQFNLCRQESVKGAVSRNSAKLGKHKMPVKLRETKITALNFKGRLK